MTARDITDLVNERLNRDLPRCTAGDLRKGDHIILGNEWITLTSARPAPGQPNMIRITGRLGEPTPHTAADPDDIVTIRIRREASMRRAGR